MKPQKILRILFLFVVTGCSPAIPAVTFTPEVTLPPAATQTATPTPLPTATSLPMATLSPEERITEIANKIMAENKLPADFSELPREQGVSIIRKVNQIKVEKGGEEDLVYISQNKETKEIEYYDNVTGQFITIPGSDRLLDENGAFKRVAIDGTEELTAAIADGSFEMPTGDRAPVLQSMVDAGSNPAIDYKAVMVPGTPIEGGLCIQNSNKGDRCFFNFMVLRSDQDGKPTTGKIVKIIGSLRVFVGGDDANTWALTQSFMDAGKHPGNGVEQNGLYYLVVASLKDGGLFDLRTIQEYLDQVENKLPANKVVLSIIDGDEDLSTQPIYTTAGNIVFQPKK